MDDPEIEAWAREEREAVALFTQGDPATATEKQRALAHFFIVDALRTAANMLFELNDSLTARKLRTNTEARRAFDEMSAIVEETVFAARLQTSLLPEWEPIRLSLAEELSMFHAGWHQITFPNFPYDQSPATDASINRLKPRLPGLVAEAIRLHYDNLLRLAAKVDARRHSEVIKGRPQFPRLAKVEVERPKDKRHKRAHELLKDSAMKQERAAAIIRREFAEKDTLTTKTIVNGAKDYGVRIGDPLPDRREPNGSKESSDE